MRYGHRKALGAILNVKEKGERRWSSQGLNSLHELYPTESASGKGTEAKGRRIDKIIERQASGLDLAVHCPGRQIPRTEELSVAPLAHHDALPVQTRLQTLPGVTQRG